MRFQALPGFRDFYPNEMSARRAVEQVWHRAATGAGFQEWDGPPLEALELFTAKSGEEIAGQLYAFTDKGGREVALRPEMTPSLARMVAARAAGLPKPIKWYCVPQFFRYERQQRGRLREFYQWNVDVIGAPEIAADAEVIAVAIEALRLLGLGPDDVVVRLNDRRLVSRLLAALDVDPESEPAVLAQIDKIDRDAGARRRLAELVGDAAANEIDAWCARLPLERADELSALLEMCADYGVGDFVEPDFRIVRGLAYYTGPVWEIFDRGRTLRAVAGGGRYDTLIEQLGGKDLPAVGFGMGDVVVRELLEDKGLAPPAPERIDVFVVPVGADMLGPARQAVRRLRASGRRADAPYAPLRVGKGLKAAASSGARQAVIVGPDEWAERAVKVRDLESGEERVIPLDEL